MSEVSDNKRALGRAEEALVVDAQIFLQRIMNEKNVSRTELAERMGVTKARISQIFSDECKNFTIRLLARAAAALGEEVEVGSRLTKAQDAQRERKRATDLVRACTNATLLWVDEGEDDGHVDALSDEQSRSWGSGWFEKGLRGRERMAA